MINTTDDRTLCCSQTCEKRFECGRANINNIGTYYVEDYSSFGTGTFTDNGCEIEHWCGKLGNYKMFEYIDIKDYGMAKEHNSKSKEIYDFISDLDFENGDFFVFKSGGDGDNGEFLMDLLDCYFKSRQ